MATKVIMPALDPGQDSGTLIEWLKEEGDQVEKGDLLMEVETDKVTLEIEAPASGSLVQITASPGDEVPVGQVIAWILAEGEAEDVIQSKENILEEQSSGATLQNQLPPSESLSRATAPAIGEKILASPKARRLAKEQGIDLASLDGSGPNGAVLAVDVSADKMVESATKKPLEAISSTWRVMVERLTQSWTHVPHFNLVRDVDMTRFIEWREVSQKKSSEKLTYTDLLVSQVAATLREHPRVNASWGDNSIVMNADINIGLAVSLEDGLIVPVIHRADEMSLDQIGTRRKNIVDLAQTGHLKPRDVRGGTFTISNLGMYGVDAFNAVVNEPQAAILAVGRIIEKVIPVEGQPAVCPMLTLTLSFDHRVVDGARGAQFLQTLSNLIENPPQLEE